MAPTDKEGFQLFLGWERNEVPNPTRITDIAVHRLTCELWDNLRSRTDYLETLRPVVASIASTRSLHTAFLRRQRKLRTSQNDDTFARYCVLSDRLYGNVYHSLEDVLSHKRQLQSELLSLECAQMECLGRVDSREHTRSLIQRTCQEIQGVKDQIADFEKEEGKYLHWDHKAADRKRKAEEMDGVETRRGKAARQEKEKEKEQEAKASGSTGKRAPTQGQTQNGGIGAGAGDPGGDESDSSDDEDKKRDRKASPPSSKGEESEDGEEESGDEGEESEDGGEESEDEGETSEAEKEAAGEVALDEDNEDESMEAQKELDEAQDKTSPTDDEVGKHNSNADVEESQQVTTPAASPAVSDAPAAVPSESEHHELDEEDKQKDNGSAFGGDLDRAGPSSDGTMNKQTSQLGNVPDSGGGTQQGARPGKKFEKPGDSSEQAERDEAIKFYHQDMADDEMASKSLLQYVHKQLNRFRKEEDLDKYLDMMNDLTNLTYDEDVAWEKAPDMEVFQVDLHGRRDFMAQLKGGNTSKPLDAYAERHLFGKTDVGRRVTVMEQLTAQHGRASAVWYKMPPLERYITGEIDVRLITPWDEMSMNKQLKHLRDDWDRAAAYFQSAEVSKETRAAFRPLHMWSEHLTASRLDPWTPLSTESGTPEEYLERLKEVVEVGTEKYYRMWEDFAAADVDEAGPGWQFAGLPQGSVDDQHEQGVVDDDLSTSVHCRAAWAMVQRKLLQTIPTPNDTMRFEVHRKVAEQDMQQHRLYWFPPLWREDTSKGDYLANLIIFTRKVRSLLPIEASEVIEEDPSSFDSERSGIQGTWNALGELGAGAYGTASLWVKLDALGRPIDKAVIKSVPLGDRNGTDDWNKGLYWSNDINHRVPLEYALPRSLNDLPESFNIVGTRGYATYETSKTYTVYLEYCPRGSLTDLMRRYQQIRTLLDESGAQPQGRIPVRVVWSIFEALASAVCLMHEGHFPEGAKPPKEAFSAFVHRDIKPENIFLADPDKDFWPQIPIVKMADFGMSVLTSKVDEAGHGGTEGWRAPELCEYEPLDDDLEDLYTVYEPHAKCDIWSLGRVMLALMNLEDPKDVPQWRYDEDKYMGVPRPYSNSLDPHSDLHNDSYYAGVRDYYPKGMRDLVESCLRLDPQERIEPAALWSAVHGHVAAANGLRGRPLRERQRDCLGEELLLMELNDKWAV